MSYWAISPPTDGSRRYDTGGLGVESELAGFGWNFG